MCERMRKKGNLVLYLVLWYMLMGIVIYFLQGVYITGLNETTKLLVLFSIFTLVAIIAIGIWVLVLKKKVQKMHQPSNL